MNGDGIQEKQGERAYSKRFLVKGDKWRDRYQNLHRAIWQGFPLLELFFWAGSDWVYIGLFVCDMVCTCFFWVDLIYKLYIGMVWYSLFTNLISRLK